MTHARFRYEPVEGAQALFTDKFVDYLLALHDRLAPQIATVLARRRAIPRRAPPTPATGRSPRCRPTC
jgi:hypothetical protein